MYECARVMRICAKNARSCLSRSTARGFRNYASHRSGARDGAPKPEVVQADSKQAAQQVAAEETAQNTHFSAENADGATSRTKGASRRPLPLSPLMDPAYLASKQKHRLPKAPPSKNPTPFQQQLAKNPYAQALATPVRMCALTRTCLPSFFLQDFELIAHPTTHEPWCLPRSLTSAHSSSTAATQSPTNPPEASSFNPTEEDLPPTAITSARPSSREHGARHGPRAYVLARSSLLKATLVPKSGFTDGHQRFSNARDSQWKEFRKQRIRWRSDVDTFVLELMRRRVVEGLKYLAEDMARKKDLRYVYGPRKKGYLVPCERGWEGVRKRKQVGAVLWMGPRGGDHSSVRNGADVMNEDEQGEAGTVEAEEPGEFATLDFDKERKSKIPVHNLRLLLGKTYVEDLRKHVPKTFDSELVVLKNRRTTIDVQLRLWKLQGYLAKHEQGR